VPTLNASKMGWKQSKAGKSRGSRAKMRYHVVDFNHIQTRVITVRGTDPLDALDILLDARLWVEDAMLTMAGILLPSITLWPDGLRSSMIQVLASPQQLFNSPHLAALNFYESGIKSIKKHQPPEGWKQVVTGHSLGGGLAGIVGAKLQLPSIAFSPPGLKFSRLKHGLRLRDLAQATILAPIRDPVPMIDKQTGLVQHTNCIESSAVHCHLPQLMVCDLLQRCGDVGNRRFRGCSVTSKSIF
jgi:hypothetical protein